MELAKEERCEFIPFVESRKVNVKDGKISSLVLCRTEQNDQGEWVEDEEQLITLKCSYVISAFGSHLSDAGMKAALAPLVLGNDPRPPPHLHIPSLHL